MKIKNIIFYIILICSVSACEKSIETERFMLSSNEKELAPYTLNQTVKFVHSNGYEFDFKVTDVKLNILRKYEIPNIMFQSGNYIAYQIKSVTMTSTYPKLTMKIELGYLNYSFVNPIDSLNNTTVVSSVDSMKGLRVYFNNHYAYLNYNKDLVFDCKSDSVSCYDSIEINGQTYLNVIESKFYYHSDSIVSSPKSVLYNSKGILQIKLCNNENFSIK